MIDNLLANETMDKKWTTIGKASDFPVSLGTCVKVNGQQIAVFHLSTEQEWYAVQNFNPSNQRMVLSRGITGDQDGVPYVACPLHKDRFSLESGECLTDNSERLEVFPLREENGELMIQA